MNVRVKELDPSYNDKMLSILRTSPMETRYMDLYFDKSPDLFSTTRLWSNDFKYFGIFLNDELAGFGMRLNYKGIVNAKPRDISYFGNYCIDKKYRNQGLFKELGVYVVKELHKDADYSFCMILKGNKSAEKYYDSSHQRSFMGPGQLLGNYESRNILITRKCKENKNINVRKARIEDSNFIFSMLQKQYIDRFLSPLIDPKLFHQRSESVIPMKLEPYYIAMKGKHPVGVCAALDISSFKKTRILNYKKSFWWIRKFYSVFSRLLQYPDLPKPGEPIKEVYITRIAAQKNNPEILKSLIQKVYNDYRNKKYNLIVMGSYKGDPLLNVTKSFFTIPVYSNIYFSAKDQRTLDKIDNSQPFIDLSLV